MPYPLISEYVEAIKMAEDNFNELSYLRPVLNDLGQPVMSSGNFAVVFKMRDERDGKLYAVRCFHRDQEGREESYRLIEEELKDVESPYLLSFRYIDKELFVDTSQTDETEFPVLLMDWVEGVTLDTYLRTNLDDQYTLELLAYRFSQLAQWLIPQPFAHGDLKPDNILVREDGTIVLIDYDGMYVPAMKGQKARELGSPDFRHPSRTVDDFDEHIDDFAITLILLSLKAISYNNDLLHEYGSNDSLLIDSYDLYNFKECRLLKKIFPSGNKILDRYAFLLCCVYYDKNLSTQLYDFISHSKPQILIPYSLSSGDKYSFYDTTSQKILPLQYKYIDFIDPTFKKSISCIIRNVFNLDKFSWDKNEAIISCQSDLNNIHWYKEVLRIGKLKTRFIVQDTQNMYGVISDKNDILLDLVFQEIKAFEVENEVYLVIKKENYYGLINKDLNVVIPCVLKNINEYPRLKLIVYKKDQESIFAMDLNTLKEYRIPSNYKWIDDYKEGIITLRLEDNQYRFYSIEKNDYINSYSYQKISGDDKMTIKNSFVICKRNGLNVLLSMNGTECIIDFKGKLSHYGEYVIGVSPIEIQYVDKYGYKGTKHDYYLYIFKKNIIMSQFIYKGSFIENENFDLINENIIEVWHYYKGNDKLIRYINFNGEPVTNPNSNNCLKTSDIPNRNKHLKNIVEEKYLNPTYISNFDELDKHGFFEIEDFGEIAFISYWSENGSCDLEDYSGSYCRIGYADENMCYWAKDCMIIHR